ncbi:hypothetical protein A2U01_0023898, partial [Trifolium medium]|nr:hypothetical protein [Trifolium medium]
PASAAQNSATADDVLVEIHDNLKPLVAPKPIKVDVVPVVNNDCPKPHATTSTSFSMALHNVRDEIVWGDIHKQEVVVDGKHLANENHESDSESVFQQIDKQAVTQTQTINDVISEDGEEVIIIPETQIT